MSNYRYDAHCHIFTFEYALLEAKNIWRDHRKPEYHFQWPAGGLLNSDEDSSDAQNKSKLGWLDIYALLKQLYELVRAASTSEADNFNFLQDEMGQAYPGDQARIVPLMMDIYPILSKPLGEGQDLPPLLKISAAVDESDLQRDWEKAMDALSEHIKSLNPTKHALLKRLIGLETTLTGDVVADFALKVIDRERALKKPHEATPGELKAVTPPTEKSTSYSSRFNFHKTDGYCHHMDKLMELVGNKHGAVYPFVAVDPRRTGIVDALKSGAFFEGTQRFYGVKLYPRLGCHPLANPMAEVYQYCEDNNLPIIFHCGMGGFPPSEKWAYSDYGNPKYFATILEEHPSLRIDFAHMGSSESSMEWKNAVMELIEKYDNAYTDFSCYTNPAELKQMKEIFWNKHPKLHDRLMFGTDYDVMYFTGKVTLQSYYRSFKKVFKNDMVLLTRVNPSRFLGL